MGGSGPDGMDRSLMRRFVELAGGPEGARVAVVPTASEERADTIERYENAFELEGVQHIDVIDIRTHHHADQPEALRRAGRRRRPSCSPAATSCACSRSCRARASPTSCDAAAATAFWWAARAPAPWRSATR